MGFKGFPSGVDPQLDTIRSRAHRLLVAQAFHHQFALGPVTAEMRDYGDRDAMLRLACEFERRAEKLAQGQNNQRR